ncbi:MAG: DNA primase [Firmicutes bacterium]|nr:DNA primase [Bacillota bacterium]
MAKLTTQQINDIRSSVDIVDIVSKYIPLTQKGKNFFGVCPFHDDHSPSMSVSQEKQIYTCFSCGATGNVFKFIMDYDNISFPEAIKKIADLVGIPLNIDVNVNKKSIINKSLYDIYELSLKFYQNNLNTNDGIIAKEYLYQRSIDDELIKVFQIGLAIKKRDLLTRLLLKKSFNETDLIKSGLIIKSEYGLNDIYYNRIMFPLYDLNGSVVGYSGRIYNTNDTSKYINTKETEIFKKGELLYNYHRAKDECRTLGQVIIVEGFMDVIRTYSIGVKNVVATMGTAVTKNQALLIKRMAKEVILLFDGDEAGAKATMSCATELEKIGIVPKVVRLDENLDPDEYILKYGEERFLTKLKNPTNIMDFKLSYLKTKKNLNNSADIAKYVNEVLEHLNNIEDDVLREITLTKLSKDSNLEIDFLRNKLEMPIKDIKLKEKNKDERKILSKYQKAEVYLINYMMKNTEVIKRCMKKLSNLPSKEYRDLQRLIVTYYNEFGYINEADFMTYLMDKDESYMETVKQIKKMNLKENFTLEEIDDYIKVILDYNIESEYQRLSDLMNKTDDIMKKAEIGQRIVELKILKGE